MSSLALVAKQAGWLVSGSDSQASSTISYLKKNGVENIYIGQSREAIESVHQKNPIGLYIYTSAISDPNHPELDFCNKAGIKTGKRDDFLSQIIKENNPKLVAVAGTHGKSTTTAMAIWVFKELGMPIGYSVGAKLNFGLPGGMENDAKFFILEADEFDRSFLSFYPSLALISGLDWDHPDIYPTRESYYEAFNEFIEQSEKTVLWQTDAEALALEAGPNLQVLDGADGAIDASLKLTGRVNRQNAWLVAHALAAELDQPLEKLLEILNKFPGLSRRFEELAPNIYTDYAHTPAKIRGALETAQEAGGQDIVVVYEGLHNLRQHFIKEELVHLFDNVKKLYIVPSYLAREDPSLKNLSPSDIKELLSDTAKSKTEPAQLDDDLLAKIKQHAEQGELVLCLTAGGGGSLDEWLRKEL